jgi:pyruvate/2-oxoglutarate dehydrogenase complex dihydrolipoamide acyltransferase (E2) component
MKSVTYRGPEDPRDRTTRYRIGEHLLPLGIAVPVPNEVAEKAAATEGHTFEVGDADLGRQITPAAAKLAAEKDLDLDSIEVDGQIGIEDIRAAIEARDTNQNA